MKILYIHQYFKTPEESGSTRSYYLAKSLVANGHRVEMITTHNQAFYQNKEIDGISVHYIPVPYRNEYGYVKRLSAFLKFVWQAIWLSRHHKDARISYVMTTPLSTGLIALFNKWFRNIPYIFEVGDLWPDVPISMNIIKNRIIIALLRKFEKRCYQHASGLVGLSPEITEQIMINSQIPGVTIPNIAECKYFKPNGKTELPKVYSINDPFVITYPGTHGRANHLEYLIDVAQHCRDLPIKFQLVGEGAMKEQLIDLSIHLNLENIHFMDPVNKSGIKRIYDRSHAIYISFLNVPFLNTGSPNKLFDGLAAGKMVIVNFSGWVADLLKLHGVGFCYNPEIPEQFRTEIIKHLEDPSKVVSCQNAARQLALNQFDLDTLSSRQLNFIEHIAG